MSQLYRKTAFALVLLTATAQTAWAGYPMVINGLNQEHCTAPAHHEVIELLARNVAYDVDSEKEIARLKADRKRLIFGLMLAGPNFSLRTKLSARLLIVSQRLAQQKAVRAQLAEGVVKVDKKGNTLRQLDSPVEIVDAIYDRKTGFQMVLVKDNQQNFTLLFRGTEPTNLADLRDDTGGFFGSLAERFGGVGARQYGENRDRINAVVAKFQAENPQQQLTVSGHSLGAAIAQRFAIDNPAIVKELVLFNAPALEQSMFDRLAAEEDAAGKLEDLAGRTTHHFGYKDIVSDLGGDTHLPGKVIIHYGGTLDGVVAPHTGEMMQQADDGMQPECVTISFEDYQRDRPGTGRYEPGAGWRKSIKNNWNALMDALDQPDIPDAVTQPPTGGMASYPVDFEYTPIPQTQPAYTPAPTAADKPAVGGSSKATGSTPRPAPWLDFLKSGR